MLTYGQLDHYSINVNQNCLSLSVVLSIRECMRMHLFVVCLVVVVQVML